MENIKVFFQKNPAAKFLVVGVIIMLSGQIGQLVNAGYCPDTVCASLNFAAAFLGPLLMVVCRQTVFAIFFFLLAFVFQLLETMDPGPLAYIYELYQAFMNYGMAGLVDVTFHIPVGKPQWFAASWVWYAVALLVLYIHCWKKECQIRVLRNYLCA